MYAIRSYYAVSRYFIEYWAEGQSKTTINIDQNLMFNLNLASGNKYFWHIGLETSEGDFIYSTVTSFSITHTQPLYVKTGGSGDGSSCVITSYSIHYTKLYEL